MYKLFNQFSYRQLLKSLGLLISASILVACQQSDFETVKGPTMGTFYQVKYLPATKDTGTLKADIDQLLKDINQQMSTYINDSELSRLNQTQSTQCLPVSSPLLEVLSEAKRVHTLSEGAFDPTLGPLIEIWGFDKKETNETIPDANSIQQGIAQLSFKQTSVNREESCVSKGRPATQINLSAIAKGYAVDSIAELLETTYQVEHYLVDIGGEVKLKGNSPRNTAWNIAIEAPNHQQRGVQRIINPGNRGVATSGDYRNYFEKAGKRYSHTINPQTGYPITHNLASVTVVHRSTMTADALATAFLVLGEEQTIKFAERENIAVFMIIKTPEGFKEVFSPSFKPFLKTRAN